MTAESKPPMRQIAELIDSIATARAESAESLLTMCEHQLTLARRDASDLRSILDDQARGLDERDAEIKRLNEAFDSEQTLRKYREEQLRLLHEDYASGVRESVRAIAECDAEIAKLKEELANAARALAPDSPGTKDMSWKGAAHYWNRVSSERGIEINKLRAELAEARERTTATVTCSRVVPTPTEIRTYMDRLADQPRTGGYVPPAAPPAESHRAWPPAAEIAAWVNDWHAGKIETRIEPAPPATDPRVDALCRITSVLFDRAFAPSALDGFNGVKADLETIRGRR